jgi:hypothetical protein
MNEKIADNFNLKMKELFVLYGFLKKVEGGLDTEMLKILHKIERFLYDTLTIEELEALNKVRYT